MKIAAMETGASWLIIVNRLYILYFLAIPFLRDVSGYGNEVSLTLMLGYIVE